MSEPKTVEMPCPVCVGTGKVRVTQDIVPGAPYDGPDPEKIPCPKCGGTGTLQIEE